MLVSLDRVIVMACQRDRRYGRSAADECAIKVAQERAHDVVYS